MLPFRLAQLFFDFENYGKIKRKLFPGKVNVSNRKFEKPNFCEEIDSFFKSSKRLKLSILRWSDLNAVFDLIPSTKDASDLEDAPFWRRELAMAVEICNSIVAYSVVEKKSAMLVGVFCVTCFEISGTVQLELGYRIHPGKQGKGYATEAANLALQHINDYTDISQISSVIDSRNEASIRVAEKAGMSFAGHSTVKGAEVVVYSFRMAHRS